MLIIARTKLIFLQIELVNLTFSICSWIESVFIDFLCCAYIRQILSCAVTTKKKFLLNVVLVFMELNEKQCSIFSSFDSMVLT